MTEHCNCLIILLDVSATQVRRNLLIKDDKKKKKKKKKKINRRMKRRQLSGREKWGSLGTFRLSERREERKVKIRIK